MENILQNNGLNVKPTALPIITDGIPSALKNFNQWIVWQYQSRDGRWTKPPFQANGMLARSNDPATWTTYDLALQHLQRNPTLDGLGFMLSSNDGLTGLDLDHVINRETNELSAAAQEIIAHFKNTYIEISPSSEGLRIWCYGKPQRSGKNSGKLKWLEVYSYPSNRYLTVTGHSYGETTEITAQQAALDWLHETFMAEKSKEMSTGGGGSDSLPVETSFNDHDLIEKIRNSKQGAQFDALWAGNHGGNWSDADLSLCNILAFWTGKDAARMDRLFRQSGLMRPKWDEVHYADGRTYGQATIGRAIAGCRDVYSGATTRLNRLSTYKPIVHDMEWHVRDNKFICIAEIVSMVECVIKDGLTEGSKKTIQKVLSCCDEGKEIYKSCLEEELPAMSPLHPDKLYFMARSIGWNKESIANATLCREQYKRMLKNANKIWAIANIEGKAIFVDKMKSRINDSFDLRFTSPNAATTINLPLKIPIVTTLSEGKEKIEWKNLINVWNNSEFRHTYNDFYFSPIPKMVNQESVDLPSGKLLNLFTGLAIKPNFGACEKILNHIFEIWCSSDTVAYAYVMGWLATMYQKPDDRGHTAIVLKSGEGAGKNIILDLLVESWGRHGITISEANQVTGRFNDHLSTAVFVFLNEALWGGDKAHEGALKRLITDKTLEVERKYVPRFEVKNCVHLMLSTNNDWAVPVGIDDRRFFILDVAETKKGDFAYFDLLANEIKNGGNAAFINYLLTYDISGFNPRLIPRGLECASKTYNDQKLRTANSVYKWWAHCLEAGFIIERDDGIRGKEIIPKYWEEEESLIDKSDAYTTYAQWCKLHGHRTESLTAWTQCLKNFDVTVGRDVKLSTSLGRAYAIRVKPLSRMMKKFTII